MHRIENSVLSSMMGEFQKRIFYEFDVCCQANDPPASSEMIENMLRRSMGDTAQMFLPICVTRYLVGLEGAPWQRTQREMMLTIVQATRRAALPRQ